MKNLIFLAFYLLFVLLFSCKKESETTYNLESDDIAPSQYYRLSSVLKHKDGINSEKTDFWYIGNQISKVESFYYLESSNTWDANYIANYHYYNDHVEVIYNTPDEQLTVRGDYVIEDGKLKEYLPYTYADGDWKLIFRQTFNYHEDFLDSSQVIVYLYDYESIAKNIYHYENGHLSEINLFNFQHASGEWILSRKTLFTYDSDSWNFVVYNIVDNEPQDYWKEINLMDGDLISKKECYQFTNASDWEWSSTEVYKYDENNNLIEDHFSSNSENYSYFFTYNYGEGNLSSFILPDRALLGIPNLVK